MRLVFIGDVFGRSGREALEKYLPDIKKSYTPDVIIVNGENASHGRGITAKIANQFFEWGADCITTGNHIWDQREIISYIDKTPALLRPLNFSPGTPGNGIWESQLPDGRKFVVINAMGRHGMELSDDPFQTIDKALQTYRLGQNCQMIFIDFHAEATSEKACIGHYLDGHVTAVIGTHTHIPTSDYRILSGGTAFQTDAGMTGCYDSVIGIRKSAAIGRFLKKVPGEKFNPADGEACLCGVLIDTDDKSGHAKEIHPIRLGGHLTQARP